MLWPTELSGQIAIHRVSIHAMALILLVANSNEWLAEETGLEPAQAFT